MGQILFEWLFLDGGYLVIWHTLFFQNFPELRKSSRNWTTDSDSVRQITFILFFFHIRPGRRKQLGWSEVELNNSFSHTPSPAILQSTSSGTNSPGMNQKNYCMLSEIKKILFSWNICTFQRPLGVRRVVQAGRVWELAAKMSRTLWASVERRHWSCMVSLS